MNATAAHQKHLLLIGSGRANLATLQAFAEQGSAETRITLVAPHTHYTEATLLGDYVAGNIDLPTLRRPLIPLLEMAGAQFLPAVPTGLDPVTRLVQLSTGETLSYDVLAINHEPLFDRAAIEAQWPGARENALFVNPIENFVQLWPQLEAMAQTRPMHIAVVGHDKRAVELAMCMADRLWQPQGSRVCLVTQGHPVMADEPARLRHKALERVRQLGIAVMPMPVVGFTSGQIHLQGGLTLSCDAPILALSPTPASWLSHTGLVVDEIGFAEVNERLQSESHRQIFIAHDPYNSDIGPAFAANLRVALHGGNFTRVNLRQPPLACISMGQQHALASWGPLSMEGSNVWNWKHHRDLKDLNQIAPADMAE